MTPQVYMIIHLAIYFGLIIGYRSFLLYRNTKINAIKSLGSKGKVGLVEKGLQLGTVIMLFLGVFFIFMKEAEVYRYVVPFSDFEDLKAYHLGLVLTLLGYTICSIAQLQMEDSWRIGIDVNNETKLIKSGLYQYSRNPIYLGLGIAFTGYFFIAPSLASWVFLLGMMLLVRRKIADEEAFLTKKFGDSYIQYKSQVRQWI